ncbi:hypothetical protein C1O35_06150 [Staphylococcus schleiferi]|uniref:Uncharacterized protein n=1 Tax=Staphylococcus schleiferi TaxID=1295 RepID=A0ABX0FYA5_STASC|nr:MULTISPECIES: hypothetical protein [Staphylococcus]QGS45336.1 hypothetical protein FOB90_00875 [Mammaliicoccus fleurettii]MBU3873838.1 hypothetical protein [Staphylococcus coagulans]NHA34026.1 hypothetical protein [Staphylococcus schleiferi]NHA37427.1 hypothetical protein [Staphylococcus schleiferi]NHA38627.1 hypothetical protein [Staphylococcus schleiferi]
MIELPVIENDRSKRIEHKGQVITIKQLAEACGATPQVVRQRLFRHGWSVEDVLNNGANRTNKIDLTKEQHTNFVSANLTYGLVRERLSAGWDLDLACRLSKKFKGDADNIYYDFHKGDRKIKAPYSRMLEAQEYGVDIKTITRRLAKGYDLEDALNKPIKRKYQEPIYIERDYALESYQAYQRYMAEKSRNRKPWLKTVPQRHERTDYGDYLFEHAGTAKIKTDMYGHQQLI